MTKKSRVLDLFRMILAGLTVMCFHAASAQEVDLGIAGKYSAFILGDVSGMIRVEGRLAVGRDLKADKLDIGSKLPQNDDTQPSLVVGRDITAYSAGGIAMNGGKKGYGVYAGQVVIANRKHDLRKDSGIIDFRAETIWLSMLSAQLQDRAATGTVSVHGNSVTLQGSNADMEVFFLSADQLKTGKMLTLNNIKATAYLIVNVLSDNQRQLHIGLKLDALKNRQSRVMFNFPDADVLKVNNVEIYGSVLAPNACMVNAEGRIEGTVVAASWDSKMEVGYAPFEAGP